MTAAPPPPSPPPTPLPPHAREEYVEQAHFYGTLAERLQENVPMQEVLASVREEVLATVKLPMAVDYLLTELRHTGMIAPAMGRLRHYFTPLQAYIVSAGEDERGRFDLRIGLEVLQREADYRAGPLAAGVPSPTPQGLFLFQFETLCRNRLSYDRGLTAMASDPAYDEPWRAWISAVRRKVGMVDLADLIYVNSQHYRDRLARERSEPAGGTTAAPLFGEREGRIALANRRKDPLLLFNSLHRQLGYPSPPRPTVAAGPEMTLPQLARRLEQFEKRVTLLEEEQRGGIDLTKFYGPPGGDDGR